MAEEKRKVPVYWLDRDGRRIAHNEDFLAEPFTSWDLTPVYEDTGD